MGRSEFHWSLFPWGGGITSFLEWNLKCTGLRGSNWAEFLDNLGFWFTSDNKQSQLPCGRVRCGFIWCLLWAGYSGRTILARFSYQILSSLLQSGVAWMFIIIIIRFPSFWLSFRCKSKRFDAEYQQVNWGAPIFSARLRWNHQQYFRSKHLPLKGGVAASVHA